MCTNMLKVKMKQDLIQAMRDKDKPKKAILQLVIAALDRLEKEKRSPLDSKEEMQVIRREVKQTEETLKEAERFGRPEVASLAKEKIQLLKGYLPQDMSADDLVAGVKAAGVTPGMPMGQAMKLAMATLIGKAPNQMINQAVKTVITE